MMRSSHRALTAMAALASALALTACGGSTNSKLMLDDIGKVVGCTAYGHSWIAGYQVDPDQTFAAEVCARYGLSVLNDGISGSALQGELSTILPEVPTDAAKQLSIVMWGYLDMAYYGTSLGQYEAGLRLLISRLRTPEADIHGASDPALRYNGAWRDVMGAKVTSTDSSFTWTSPRGFRGGTVALEANLRQGYGGTYTFTLDGKPVGSWDTRALPPPPPSMPVTTPGAYRIRVPPGAGHTIHCALTNVATMANVLGWQLEASKPPLVILVQQARLPAYTAFDAPAFPFHPHDAQVALLNRVIARVASEFDSYVITVDPDSALGRRTIYLNADGVHPNVEGNRVIAGVIERAIGGDPHARILGK